MQNAAPSTWACSECGLQATKGRAKGLCKGCYHKAYKARHYTDAPEKRSDEWRRTYAKNRDKIIAKTTVYNRNLKVEMIAALGGKCACCGETQQVFLTMDHIAGNGGAHRRQISGTGRANSIMVYADARRRGWPRDEFQVLCWNCNFAKHALGCCPHSQLPSAQLVEDPAENAEANDQGPLDHV